MNHADHAAPAHAHGHDHGHEHNHGHAHPAAAPERALRRLRPFPARSLLGAGLPARLGLAALALATLWTTVLWALR